MRVIACKKGADMGKKGAGIPGVFDEVHVGAVDSDAVAVESVVAHPSGVSEPVVLRSRFHPDHLADGVQQRFVKAGPEPRPANVWLETRTKVSIAAQCSL
jgi:hypothetical protein